MSKFEIKDSGQRQDFGTGAVRDTSDQKGSFDLLPFYAIYEVARVYQEGAKKYGRNNYRKGINLSRYLDAALRHLMKAGAGFKDEPHFAQAAWNILSLIETKHMIDSGMLPKELDDLDNFSGNEWYSQKPVEKKE